MKSSLVRKVVSNVIDFDMHNLFPPRTFMETLEEAEEGAFEVQPQRTLRERQYGPMPIVVRPEYKGDFLEKLKDAPDAEKLEKYMKNSDNSENIMDFSMPSEMLKHQEEPQPRDLAPEWYERNRPGDEGGMEIIRDWYDRGWDPTDSPEMSEDKILRMREPGIPQKTFKLPIQARITHAFLEQECQEESGPCPSTVTARYLMDYFSMDGVLDFRKPKVAKLLKDFEDSLITTKAKGTRRPDDKGVSVRLARAEPRVGRWTFRTSSGKDVYTTIFQFIPQGVIRDPNKLHVRVSCSCPSFLFWGAQYHAIRENYLYGRIRPKFAPPTKRDPRGRFLVCKHILACIPVVSNYKLQAIPGEMIKKIRKAPRFEVEKGPEEKLKIPKELITVGRRSRIRDIINKWEDLSSRKRRTLIMKLEDPDELFYLAHRFPDTSTGYVAEKMTELAKKPRTERKAEKYLEELEKMTGEELAPETPEMPPELKRLDKSSQVQNHIRDLEKKNTGAKKRSIMEWGDPDGVAYTAYKFSDNNEILSMALEKLDQMAKELPPGTEKEKAKKWLRIIV